VLAKRLSDRLLHVAVRLAFSGRSAKLHFPAHWPRTETLKATFERLNALPDATGYTQPLATVGGWPE
jgi:hypothetical protein